MIRMRSILLVFLGACSYGILSTIVKKAYDAGFGPAAVTGSQIGFGFACLWLVVILLRLMKKGSITLKLSAKQWLQLLIVGSTTGFTGVLYYSSLSYIPASLAIVLLFQFTWIGVLVEAVLTRTVPNRATVTSLGLLIVGTFLAGGVLDQGMMPLPWQGVVLGLLSAVSYTVFILFSGRTAVEVPPLLRSAVMVLGSAITVNTIFPPAYLMDGSLVHGLAPYGILLALFGAVIPILFYTIGVPHIGGSLASILSSAELPMAVLLSSAVLQEHVSSTQWLGVAVILIGIVWPEVIRLRSERRKAVS